MTVHAEQNYLEAARGLELPPAYIGRHINVGSTVTLAVGAVRSEICAYRIPSGLIASIRFVANAARYSSDLANIIWSLTVDGSDVMGYSQFRGQLSPSVRSPQATAIMLNGGQRIVWVASNTTNASISGVSAMFRGWMWSPDLWPVGEKSSGNGQ